MLYGNPERLRTAIKETGALLAKPDWMGFDYRERVLEIALSQLLVLGHLLEIAFHPQGALRRSWNSDEKT